MFLKLLSRRGIISEISLGPSKQERSLCTVVNYRRHSLFSHSLNEDRENSETHRLQEYVALQPIITMTAWLSKTVGPYSDGNVGGQETPFTSGRLPTAVPLFTSAVLRQFCIFFEYVRFRLDLCFSTRAFLSFHFLLPASFFFFFHFLK